MFLLQMDGWMDGWTVCRCGNFFCFCFCFSVKGERGVGGLLFSFRLLL